MRKPDDEIIEINTNESYSRWPRHAYFDRPASETRNITDLKPLQTYSFSVQAWNRLGQTNFTEPTSIQTDDAPLDPSLQQPYDMLFNPSSAELHFKPTLDPGMYCLQVGAFALVRRCPCAGHGSIASVLQAMQTNYIYDI